MVPPSAKYRQMLLETGTEEIGHVEMLATAVALNLEGAPVELQDEAAKSPVVAAVLGGMDPRQYLSAGFAALASDANGVPFNGSHVYASGNLAADMYANVTAESTGRILACRLHAMTDDSGMKDMLQFLIARDTMHQNQWLAVLEELGGPSAHPIPNSFPQAQENHDFNYVFLSMLKEGGTPPQGRWSQGSSVDGKGEFEVRTLVPQGGEPKLAPPRPEGYAQAEDLSGGMMRGIKDTAKGILGR